MKSGVLNLLYLAELPPTVEEILNCDYMGEPPLELDGEQLLSLEEILEECAEVDELERMVQPSGVTWELGMVVTPKDRDAARRRNARYRRTRPNAKG